MYHYKPQFGEFFTILPFFLLQYFFYIQEVFSLLMSPITSTRMCQSLT